MAPQIDCRVTERRTFYGQVHVVGDDHLLAGGHRHLTSDDNLFAGAEKKAANCFKCFVKLVERRKPRLCQEVVHYDRSARSFVITSIKCPRYKCTGHIKCRESSQLQPMYEIRVSFGLALTLLKFLFLLSIHETQHILQLFLI